MGRTISDMSNIAIETSNRKTAARISRRFWVSGGYFEVDWDDVFDPRNALPIDWAMLILNISPWKYMRVNTVYGSSSLPVTVDCGVLFMICSCSSSDKITSQGTKFLSNWVLYSIWRTHILQHFNVFAIALTVFSGKPILCYGFTVLLGAVPFVCIKFIH